MMEPWIKVERITANKAQVRKIARRLGVPQMHAFGCCVMFWIYADAEMTTDGLIPMLDPEDLDGIVGLDGFAEALVGVNWIEFTDEGAVVRKHDAHMSQHAKARADGNRRVSEHRARKSQPDTTKEDAQSSEACNGNALHPCNAESLPEESRGDNKRTTSTSRARGAAAVEGDEREKIRSEGGEWTSLIAPLVDSGVIYAAKAIRAGQKRLTPPKVRELIAVFQANRDRLPDPAALVTRIETGGADDDPLSGWGKPVSPPAKQRGPTFYDLLDDLERDLDRRGVKGEERVRQIDAFYERHGKQAGPTLEGTAA